MIYRVQIPIYAAVYAEVEADSPEEALERVDVPYLCAQCGGWGASIGQSYIELSDDPDWDAAKIEEIE